MPSHRSMTPIRFLPEQIAGLRELAYNLWWSWHPEAQALFSRIDPDLWEQAYHNPVRFLRDVSRSRLEAALQPSYLADYERVMADFCAYMDGEETWYARTYGHGHDRVIAYFTPEFGLHESLPIYSGGLGILSGDHCKEASDLGVPLVGVGFLYPQGYFLQRISPDGSQEAIYSKISFPDVPALCALGSDGKPVMIRVDLAGQAVHAMVWRIQVGRVPIFLMDTDVELNAPQHRELFARLYGGDQEMRIVQEIMLGIGGVRTLRAVGVDPAVWHMNEGHAAFMTLERLRELVRAGVEPSQAREQVRRTTVFTTHTPVPAGNDAFAYELVEKYFSQQWHDFGMSRDEFFGLAREDLPYGPRFSMTVLALRMAGLANGVSRIHGSVSRSLWSFVWPDRPLAEIPIGHITNGVHTATWLAPEMGELYDRYLPTGWRDALDEPGTWDSVLAIPDEELWRVRGQLKAKLLRLVRERVGHRWLRLGAPPSRLAEVERLLDADTLTIGFARRFATYKRATLLFRDMDRLHRLLNRLDQPVQLIFAGKAHPNDEPGKHFIREIYRLAELDGLRGRVVFLEEYDMCMARHLVQGVDLWLNNPRRPNEASGTSGQKAALNGVPSASVLDGWWPEAFNGRNGWGIASSDSSGHDHDAQDEADSRALYDVLEHEVIPLYYERGSDGIPHGWLAVVKEAIRTVAPAFNTRRMLKEYLQQMYCLQPEPMAR